MKAKPDTTQRFVIIMAGGRGERFWPVSREKMPKQLLTLLGNRSFLQQAVDRVLPLVPVKNILVITNEVQAPEVRKQLPKLPKENVVAEPVGRDTCAAVTLGAALVGARTTTGVMAVLPADHVIPEEKKFQQVLGDAFDLAGRGQAIITIGIKPTEPATGYGYIRVGETLPPPQGVKSYKTLFHRAEQFVEKPNFDRALEYHPTDDFPLYGIGFTHAILNDYPKAEAYLAKAVAVNGIVMASARSLLEQIYKSQHNQSLNGLEQVIAKAKAELGLS